jgi:hypothetical protein
MLENEPMKRYVLTLFGAMLLAASPVMAQHRPDRFQITGPDYGVALTPAVYFVNFLFMYFSNPGNAANMPAYRAPIPPQLATCLLDHPEGCRYADYQQYFNGQDVCADGNGGDKCRWKLQCQVEPSTQHLAPPEISNPDQINAPLGTTHATQLARNLGIDEEFVLTPEEYRCLIGAPGQRSHDQDTINVCIHDLTNSTGAADIPLSSYGLALDDPLRPGESLVRSVCAPRAACLRMNKVIAGPLEKLAHQCGFEDKLWRLLTETPMVRFSVLGYACQSISIARSEDACMAESIRRR